MSIKNFLKTFDREHKTWMYACTKCGDCVDECPVYQQTSDPYTAPGYKIKKMRSIVNNSILPFFPGLSEGDTKKLAQGIYECTLCGRCASVCPYQYDLVDLWEVSRESAVENGLEPTVIRDMIDITVADKNYLKR
ncbi:MAG: (Fe-S)-binding protein, partial [Candidatus Bathyarchaeota archaeon]